MSSDHLAEVLAARERMRAANAARREAEAAYRAALQAARDSGLSSGAIARALGVSPQLVLKLTVRPS